MNAITLPAIAYVCTSQDIQRLKTANPTNAFLAELPQQEDELLRYFNDGAVQNGQALDIVAYLTIYAGIHGSQGIIRKLRRLIASLGISLRFVRHVDRALSPHYPSLLAGCNNDPLLLLANPSDDVRRRINALAEEARTDGSYKVRNPIEGLSPKEYEHSLDRMCLNVLQKTKGLDTLIRLFSKHWNERFSAVRFTGSNLRLGPDQLPEIFDMFSEACGILQVNSVPRLYVQQQRVFNAFVTGVDDPIVVFTSEILEQLNYSEQLFIAGHELGHAKSEHILYSMIADMISGHILEPVLATIGTMTLGFSGPVILALKCALFNWQRASELTADRAGLLCCQDIDVAMSCLMRMAGTPPKYASSMNVEAFKNQAREFQELDFDLRDKVIKTMILLDRTHPWTIMRGHELLKWYESGNYQRVLDRMPVLESNDDDQTSNAIFGDLPAQEQSDGDGVSEDNFRFCSQCGARQSADGSFCTECGNNLQ